MLRKFDLRRSNKIVIPSLAAVALAALLIVISAFVARRDNNIPVPGPLVQATMTAGAPTPTLQTLVMLADVTPSAPAETATATLSPSATASTTATVTPTDTPDLDPNPAASETIPVPTNTSTPTARPAAPAATAQPKKAAQDPSILPNGVRYGDHNPKLPGRIVRIASPNIKLDTKVYEVYATKKGVWEVADYAAGHHFNSKNPGEGGNIVMSGHNNWHGEVFRYLEFLQPGNEIDVWTLDGKEYKYRVEQVEKLKEAGASMTQRIQNGKVMDPTPSEQLTLITCWPYTTFTHRLIVIARPL